MACCEKWRAYQTDRYQQQRDERYGVPGLPPRPVGANVPKLVGGGRAFRFYLDRRSLDALQRLKDADWAAARRRGERPRTHQLSRIVREAVGGFENGRRPPSDLSPLFCQYPCGVHLDARTRQILRFHADAWFGGNRSACLRAMLFEAAKPVAVTAGRNRPRY